MSSLILKKNKILTLSHLCYRRFFIKIKKRPYEWSIFEPFYKRIESRAYKLHLKIFKKS
nr:MAG TPA: hypothetical protein [Caudoviricetes sp.]